MPTIEYEVPDVKMSDQEKVMPLPSSPRMYLPVNKDIAEETDVDQELTFTVTGKVRSVSNEQYASENDRYELTVEVSKVSFEANQFADLAEND